MAAGSRLGMGDQEYSEALCLTLYSLVVFLCVQVLDFLSGLNPPHILE